MSACDFPECHNEATVRIEGGWLFCQWPHPHPSGGVA